MTTVAMELSRQGVQAALAQVREYAASLDTRAMLATEAVAEVGAAAAKAVVGDGAAIAVEPAVDGHQVVASGEQVAFMEFGTGVVGQGTYPAALPIAWGYDLRLSPWAHDPDDPTLWYYYDDGGEVRSTRGQTAGAFMLAASEAMRAGATSAARAVFAS